MCVIFYQTLGDDLMTIEEFKAMAKTNHDGMGMMYSVYNEKGSRHPYTIKYKKGYFNVDNFYDDYLKIKQDSNIVEIACHFRFGTGSYVNKQMCHPFPIVGNKKQLKRLSGEADVCIMHNGIVGNSTVEMSDTALFVKDELYPRYKQNNRFWEYDDSVLVDDYNKFVVMSSDGSELFGDWQDYNGKCVVSNKHWLYHLNRWDKYTDIADIFRKYNIGYAH
jgi:predicted glutamine amidotransferase